jgi:hypothetical protein
MTDKSCARQILTHKPEVAADRRGFGLVFVFDLRKPAPIRGEKEFASRAE